VKIISWNVNGLRAAMSKDAFGPVFALNPDLLCLQEIKVKPEQLSNSQVGTFDGYEKFWNSAERPGYSGVATFAKQSPELVEFSLGEARFDSEGRLIRTDYEDLALFNLYVPNGQRDQGRLDYKLDFYAKLLELCDQLHQEEKHLVLFGDMNTAHQPIDLKNPKQNETNSGFLPEERAWIDKYLEHGFVDIFREMHGDLVQYTWWTYRMNARERNIGWRLDYFLVSKELAGEIEKVEIYDQIMGSDHCPIGLELRAKRS
jgi:exodeoxyribonuclease-3